LRLDGKIIDLAALPINMAVVDKSKDTTPFAVAPAMFVLRLRRH
jgi:hypothetical protein